MHETKVRFDQREILISFVMESVFPSVPATSFPIALLCKGQEISVGAPMDSYRTKGEGKKAAKRKQRASVERSPDVASRH